MPTEDKVRENRLRRMAERQGFVLRKNRRRDPRAIDFGRWYVIDAERNITIRECTTLDQVENWLIRDERPKAAA